jgi:hypothetical protein
MRSIRLEHKVSDIIDQAEKADGRISEVYRGIEWLISRNPEMGIPVPRTNPQLYLFKIDPVESANSKGILLLYSYNDSYVNVIDIKIFE